jgi:predicted metal-dependent hydrolase
MILRLLRPNRPPVRPPDPAVIEVDHLQDRYCVILKRSAKARRYGLRISMATRQVVLTMPLKADLDTAIDFARRHGGWIATRLARLPQSVPFAAGNKVPLRGEPHLLRAIGGRGARITAQIDTDGNACLDIPGDPAFLARRLKDFLKREALRDLDQAVTRYAQMIDVSVKGITLRDTKSRWGSCSSQGTLNFSWRLIMAPPFVLDYLAAHEIAHRREMNHSSRYWRLLNSMTPDVERAEAWLKSHGTSLHHYGS